MILFNLLKRNKRIGWIGVIIALITVLWSDYMVHKHRSILWFYSLLGGLTLLVLSMFLSFYSDKTKVEK